MRSHGKFVLMFLGCWYGREDRDGVGGLQIGFEDCTGGELDML